ncbi:tetratricopeptide repeat protein [Aetokthonos hydrillicola Thurmond2011]|jgi:tetratricopeptide (TPR) repeat protein|uniref:Tetratricopeptide repeat protein n=1 Tax=Aetokthonos hydrillicola Thurmond2011 TaxID=2712845 RepID=A0AAP5ID90_9CYAN|nr:tetratricopeptide repeat protein [Aetokthonos hydrillicola]MBO3457978.1 tetratricopeptide repeat protein [Aetokthonos hydrillicola CCALA 1050]MBW4591316.1 tetratricopeptide repeat protein [Aetokthonos hydrillicola CCALA 1050]MDR9899356.1 tetratricopeptide repeat protein [Aetokthonos hydrillicola Thurmond2011]
MTQALYKPKRLWLVLITIPIATLLITLYLYSRSFQLPALYRYSLSQSLPGNDNRRATIQEEITFYQKRVRQNPESGMNLASLAQAYLKMAKATGESNWYLLAEQAAKRSLSNLPFSNQSALIVLSRVAQARHNFTEAIGLSQQVLKMQRYNENALAILVTSNLAMGKLEVAKTAADELVNKTPSQGNITLQALVMLAQGKEKAATDTFKFALAAEEAGETGSSAYTRVLMGQFYYKHGQLELAENLYKEALRIIPRYPLALLHLAELKTRQGEYKEAENLYAQVLPNSQNTTTIFDHAVFRGQAKIKQLQGKPQEASALVNQAEKLLRQENAAGHNEQNFGHRRELARLLLEKNRSQDTAEALSLMQTEIKIRRDAQTLDTLAWALFDSGRIQEAQKMIQEALQLGTKDAAIFYRAATIEKALGNNQQTLAYQNLSHQIDPSFDQQARRTSGLGVENFGF